MLTVGQLTFADVDGVVEMFTPAFCDYFTHMHNTFGPRVAAARESRAQAIHQALHDRRGPTSPPVSSINTKPWQVPTVPNELRKPGIEITGPASITNMFINALNPGPEGARAEADLDDDEDSAGHRLVDTVRAAVNRMRAVEGGLSYHDADRGRDYAIQDGTLPFFMHRERGLHLDEPEVTLGDQPVSAAILGTALTLFHAGRAQAERGLGIYFYLPKMESAKEAAFWRDFFAESQARLDHLRDAVIRGIPLVESLPAVYEMEEMLQALGPYAAGLNAARWDLKASILEYVMANPDMVWPDRFAVDIKTTDFLSNIFRRLVAVCLKHGAVAIGGMATALPSRDEKVNVAAAIAIRADKEWEAAQGFTRGWVAHIYHMNVAAGPFKALIDSGWEPTTEMADPDNYPIEIQRPDGPITLEGTRRNLRTLIEYVEGWLNGRGAKGIDSLMGRPGLHPALMEDLATARISVAQTAQRIIHSAKDANTGQAHDLLLVKKILLAEEEDIVRRLKEDAPTNSGAHRMLDEAKERYRHATKITMQWIKNYTVWDFRSLGSYTRNDLAMIAEAPDAI
jgi:malate synthase